MMFVAAMQTLQSLQQQQIQVSGDRPIMPVVSMSAQQNAQQMQQTLQQTIQAGMSQGLPIQSNLAVTQQPMTMGMQQIHPVRTTQQNSLFKYEVLCELLDAFLKLLFVVVAAVVPDGTAGHNHQPDPGATDPTLDLTSDFSADATDAAAGAAEHRTIGSTPASTFAAHDYRDQAGDCWSRHN